MGDTVLACLEEISGCDPYKLINVNAPKFSIGRGIQNSFVIPVIQVSRTHCKFSKNSDGCWTIMDTSLYGTYLNDRKLKRYHAEVLKYGDKIQIGPSADRLIYRFKSAEPEGLIKSTISSTKRPQEPKSITTCTVKTFTEKCLSKKRIPPSEPASDSSKEIITTYPNQPSNESNAQSRSVQIKSKRPESILDVKVKELENKLNATDQLNKELTEKLKQELIAKEKLLLKEKEEKEQLENDIKQLLEEKAKIETATVAQLKQRNAECEELMQLLRLELMKVKDFNQAKQTLDHHLHHASVRDGMANKDFFKEAQADLISNMNSEMEKECSVCNEMFMLAATVKCMHRFCSNCINQWKQKKNECPVCHSTITTSNRASAVASFIDQMVESLKDDLCNQWRDFSSNQKTLKNILKNNNHLKKEVRIKCSGGMAGRHINMKHTNCSKKVQGCYKNGKLSSVHVMKHHNCESHDPGSKSRIVVFESSKKCKKGAGQSSDMSMCESDGDMSDFERVDSMDDIHERSSSCETVGFCGRCGDDGHETKKCPYFDAQLNLIE